MAELQANEHLLQRMSKWRLRRINFGLKIASPGNKAFEKDMQQSKISWSQSTAAIDKSRQFSPSTKPSHIYSVVWRTCARGIFPGWKTFQGAQVLAARTPKLSSSAVMFCVILRIYDLWVLILISLYVSVSLCLSVCLSLSLDFKWSLLCFWNCVAEDQKILTLMVQKLFLATSSGFSKVLTSTSFFQNESPPFVTCKEALSPYSRESVIAITFRNGRSGFIWIQSSLRCLEEGRCLRNWGSKCGYEKPSISLTDTRRKNNNIIVSKLCFVAKHCSCCLCAAFFFWRRWDVWNEAHAVRPAQLKACQTCSHILVFITGGGCTLIWRRPNYLFKAAFISCAFHCNTIFLLGISEMHLCDNWGQQKTHN